MAGRQGLLGDEKCCLEPWPARCLECTGKEQGVTVPWGLGRSGPFRDAFNAVTNDATER